MSMFHIWNPAIDPEHPQAIQFVLTRSDADSINQGTEEFFKQALADLGLKAEVKSWDVKRYRSKYYTDFLGEDDWRDNWQFVWRARVVMSHKIGKLPKMAAPWVETDAVDETWEVAPDDDDAMVGCLVIADFGTERALEKAQKAIADDLEKAQRATADDAVAGKLRKKYSVGKPTFNHTKVLEKYPQLQIDLGDFPGKFFAQGAGYAEQVMELCRQAKGTVHFSERM